MRNGTTEKREKADIHQFQMFASLFDCFKAPQPNLDNDAVDVGGLDR